MIVVRGFGEAILLRAIAWILLARTDHESVRSLASATRPAIVDEIWQVADKFVRISRFFPGAVVLTRINWEIERMEMNYTEGELLNRVRGMAVSDKASVHSSYQAIGGLIIMMHRLALQRVMLPDRLVWELMWTKGNEVRALLSQERGWATDEAWQLAQGALRDLSDKELAKIVTSLGPPGKNGSHTYVGIFELSLPGKETASGHPVLDQCTRIVLAHLVAVVGAEAQPRR